MYINNKLPEFQYVYPFYKRTKLQYFAPKHQVNDKNPSNVAYVMKMFSSDTTFH